MAEEQFKYSALSSTSSFRLLEYDVTALASEQFSGPLNIRLIESSLENPPAYDAISYTWDNQHPTRRISCNNKDLHITPNCYQVLQNIVIVQGYGAKTLWIDAVCIDQLSAAEKSVYVPNMRDVYRKAQCVGSI
ncbi:heterokaryon incompatibility protein-domain-containing protein [Lophiotrema nucula]|uniref:Heterokaryon incompatibility protein-domain-containing protein n=1 Tax=Lophiotrema nucula TaxID=690887 RepID=A0A6A5ZCR9_9PLEO|nr:heterokaryon incompatibility protein-domain-containing protein [Lophiotrema nucula]